MTDFIRNHKPLWSSEELKIVYDGYDKKSIYELAKLLPNRSLSAIKNKVKLVKYGKNKKKNNREKHFGIAIGDRVKILGNCGLSKEIYTVKSFLYDDNNKCVLTDYNITFEYFCNCCVRV